MRLFSGFIGKKVFVFFFGEITKPNLFVPILHKKWINKWINTFKITSPKWLHCQFCCKKTDRGDYWLIRLKLDIWDTDRESTSGCNFSNNLTNEWMHKAKGQQDNLHYHSRYLAYTDQISASWPSLLLFKMLKDIIRIILWFRWIRSLVIHTYYYRLWY